MQTLREQEEEELIKKAIEESMRLEEENVRRRVNLYSLIAEKRGK